LAANIDNREKRRRGKKKVLHLMIYLATRILKQQRPSFAPSYCKDYNLQGMQK
jgi:hypothetical protein